MKSYRNKLINLFTNPVANRRQLERHTIEYWSKREPFRSSGRAFGHIELMNPIETPDGLNLVVRGWIFDTSSQLKNLRVLNPLGDTGTTIANLTRIDVITNMPSYPHSRASGFLSLLPLRHTAHELQLRASYHIRGEQINVVFESTPVSLGVTNPGETIRASRVGPLGCEKYVAIILSPDSVPHSSVIESILRQEATLASNIAVFSDIPKHTLEDISSAPSWQRRIDASLQDITGTLLQFLKTLERIIVVGPLTSGVVQKQLLPVLAHPPIPPIMWIPRGVGGEGPAQLIPQELRGNLIERVEFRR